MEALTPKLQPGFMTNLDDFMASIAKEDSFIPPGEILSTYTVNEGITTNSCYLILLHFTYSNLFLLSNRFS